MLLDSAHLHVKSRFEATTSRIKAIEAIEEDIIASIRVRLPRREDNLWCKNLRMPKHPQKYMEFGDFCLQTKVKLNPQVFFLRVH